MCADTCRELEDRLKSYLRRQNCSHFPENWTVRDSPISGRGVFARRPIRCNEVVLVDVPLVVGPRTNEQCPVICVECGRRGPQTCPRGCLLPLCVKCGVAPTRHSFECEYVRKLEPKVVAESGVFSRTLYKSVTPIRCLSLDEGRRGLVRCLQSNEGPQHSFEVDLLRKSVQKPVNDDDEAFMRLCCRVMDANAFETVALHAGNSRTDEGYESSLRGLYPLAAIMNHSCSPNTRLGFDSRQRLFARATKEIKADEEITTSYSPLLWPTPTRRKHLMETKHFLCGCFRCQDPSELGSWLFLMDCPSRGCKGQVQPADLQSLTCKWSCNECDRTITAEQVSVLQNIRNSAATNFDLKDLSDAMASLRDGHKLGQAAVRLKLRLIWSLGHAPKHTWPELEESVLLFKKYLCEDILQLLQSLQLGLCRLRGLILQELCLVLNELKKRKSKSKGKGSAAEVKRLTKLAAATLKEAMEIIKREE